MKEFLRFYRWGMTLKYTMCMYGLAILFVKWFVLLVQGEAMMPIRDVFWMTMAGFLIALVQYFCFDWHAPSPEESLVLRTVVYLALSNIIVIGGSALFDWFPGLPAWVYAVLIVVLNVGVMAMWVGVHIALKFDTNQLNRGLRAFQQKV